MMLFVHPQLLAIPFWAIHAALLVAALGALDGAHGLFNPRAAARSAGLDLIETARGGAVRGQAGARFLSHAVTLVALWRAPAIGACLAAALGSGWFGASAGRMMALGARRTSGSASAGVMEGMRILTAGAFGVILWWPLWSYLAMLRLVGDGSGAAA